MSEIVLFLLSAIVSAIVNLSGRLRGRAAPRRILVVKLDHLGDVVLATPATRALRVRYPEASIDALVHPGSAVVLAGNPSITRILTYRSPRFARGRAADGLSRLREIARARYDTLVELRGDERTLLLPFLCGATRRVDRGAARIRHALRRLRPGTPRVIHEVEANLEVVLPLIGPRSAGATRPALEVRVDPEARASMLRKLADRGIRADARLVVIHPGAAWRPRAWRSERFGAVADWILGHYDATVVLIGSEDERGVEDEVRRSIQRSPVHALAGRMTLEEVTALLEMSALFLGNDSGPAHLASACGVPSIVLFGPQDPRRFRPWSERTYVLHRQVPCFPCRQTVCVMSENPCVNRNEVAEVIARAGDLLGSPRTSSRTLRAASAAG